MNAAKVRHCLLAIASINHALMRASAGNECLDSLTDGITDLLLLGGKELEREAHNYPVRLLTLEEFDTQELLPVTAGERATEGDCGS